MKPQPAPAGAVQPRTVDMVPLTFRAAVQSVNEEDRTVDLVWTTGAPVMRYDWFSDTRYQEVLSLDPAHVRLDRLNDGGPLLDSHSSYSVGDILGAVVPGSVTLTKKEGRAKVRFSKRAAVEPIWQDVRDGIVRSVSVGYLVHKFEETKPGKDNALPIRKAIDWEPHELSMVPVPADAGAKTRAGEKVPTHPCEIVSAATREEKPMKPDTPEFIADQPAIIPPAPPAPAPEPNEGDLARAEERSRVQGILTACRAARLPQSFADRLIADGAMTLVRAQSLVFEELAKRGGQDVGPGPTPSGGGARLEMVGDDPLVHARAGIVNAVLNRVAGDRFTLEEIGRPYRGMSLLDIGRAFLSHRGMRTSNMSRSQLVDAMLARVGMHTTSDFPMLLEDVASKNLRSAYEAAPQTWRPLARQVNLSDFKPSRQLQVGDAPELLEVLEHGEFTSGTIGEAKETIQLATYGRVFGITRQALINDDLNAFGQVPALFGRKAADKESDLAWLQITANGLMGDGVALFAAAAVPTGHANLTTGPGTVISVASLGVGRAAIRRQKGIDNVTPLNLAPRFLIVPTSLETLADQFVTQITPAQNSNANPFGPGGRTPLQVIVESRLDDDSVQSWYMAASQDQAPVLYHGTLDGQAGPEVRQMEGFDIDGIRFRCRIDVAFKAADWRPVYKNAGA